MIIGFATYNRKSTSLKFLKTLLVNDGMQPNDRIVVFDDGSTDGTVTELIKIKSDLEIFRGDGSFFWSKSMYVIHEYSSIQGEDLLMVNDDIELYPNSLSTLRKYISLYPNSILVGSFVDQSNIISYSGLNLIKGFRFKLELTTPDPENVKQIQSFNGNFCFIPNTVTNKIGLLAQFSHSYSDTEYGIRAFRNGVPMYLLPGPIGICNFNYIRREIFFSKLSLRSKIHIFISPKGYPFRDLLKLYKLSEIKMWQLQFTITYLGNFAKMVIFHILRK